MRFLEKRPLTVTFSKLCSESLHGDTDRRCCVENVVKFCRWKIAEIVRYLRNGKNISAPSQTVATARIAPTLCQGQPPTFGLQCSKFHPNRFTFGGVIAKRVKTVLLAQREIDDSPEGLRANNEHISYMTTLNLTV